MHLSFPPQVRPKTLIPDSLPLTPGRDRPPQQPPTFQKATVVSIKNPSPALPTANNTVSHVPTAGGRPQALAEPGAISSALSGAGVAYAIISTAPSNAAAITPSTAVSVVSDSIKVQPLLISADSKVRGRPQAGPGRARAGWGAGVRGPKHGPGGMDDQTAGRSGGLANGRGAREHWDLGVNRRGHQSMGVCLKDCGPECTDTGGKGRCPRTKRRARRRDRLTDETRGRAGDRGGPSTAGPPPAEGGGPGLFGPQAPEWKRDDVLPRFRTKAKPLPVPL